jgi:hypothetical protein
MFATLRLPSYICQLYKKLAGKNAIFGEDSNIEHRRAYCLGLVYNLERQWPIATAHQVKKYYNMVTFWTQVEVAGPHTSVVQNESSLSVMSFGSIT